MTKQLFILFCTAAAACMATPAATSQAATTGNEVENLTLEQALELAYGRQPEIAEALAMIAAAEGRARQAGAYPNPEAIVGAQQVPFSGNAPNQREHVAGVAQTIPLTRRLSKAREAELLDRDVRARGLEVKRREIHRRVHGAFATALYQEQAYRAQTNIHQNSARTVATTQARLEAGDVVLEDLARVEIELARAKVELQRAQSLHQQALLELAAAVGDSTLRIKSLTGSLDATFDIPALEEVAANLSSQPESLQAQADIRARSARVDLAKAERIPDVRVEMLYHRLEASRENTFDIGLSVVLPVFNRNQGRVREARAELAAAEARARTTQNELATRLHESFLQLHAALANSSTFKTEILAKAELVLQAAEARYAAGDISLTELLPVRRDWAAVQLSYLESLRDVMRAWGEVKRFSARQ